MHTRGTRVLLRHYLEQGVGKAELARRFGVSRRTVYNWIETGQLDRDLDDAAVHYASRPSVSRQLDAYRGDHSGAPAELPVVDGAAHIRRDPSRRFSPGVDSGQ
jgi:transposase-like protein